MIRSKITLAATIKTTVIVLQTYPFFVSFMYACCVAFRCAITFHPTFFDFSYLIHKQSMKINVSIIVASFEICIVNNTFLFIEFDSICKSIWIFLIIYINL